MEERCKARWKGIGNDRGHWDIRCRRCGVGRLGVVQPEEPPGGSAFRWEVVALSPEIPGTDPHELDAYTAYPLARNDPFARHWVRPQCPKPDHEYRLAHRSIFHIRRKDERIGTHGLPLPDRAGRDRPINHSAVSLELLARAAAGQSELDLATRLRLSEAMERNPERFKAVFGSTEVPMPNSIVCPNPKCQHLNRVELPDGLVLAWCHDDRIRVLRRNDPWLRNVPREALDRTSRR